MGDSYRPSGPRGNDRYRGRDYDIQTSYHDDRHHYNRGSRSRSPPRRLDYDDDDGDKFEEGGRSRNGSYDDRRQYTRGSSHQDRRQPRARYYERERDRMYNAMYQAPPAPPPANCGEKDASTDDTPSKFILVRELKESITEELFARGLEKLYCATPADRGSDTSGATPKSLRRVLLIRERETDKSMPFGFAEYHSLDEAVAAVAKARVTSEDKLTISSKKFTIAFPHMGVFPHASFGRPEFNDKYTIEVAGSHELHKYHDDRYYASELIVNRDLETTETRPKGAGNGEKKSKKKEGKETLESKSKKRKAPGAVPAYLEYYQKKQAELRGKAGESTASTEMQQQQQPATGVNTIAPIAAAPVAVSDVQTFAHTGSEGGITACYLCAAQFNTHDGILRHLKESEKHAQRLEDEEAKSKAYNRMKFKGIDPDSTIKLPSTSAESSQVMDNEPKYRDRAAERRHEEVQTGVTKGQKVGFSLKKPKNHSSASSDNDTSTNTKPSYGKGLDMLQKAGWTSGQSLGAGNGVTAPIEQNLYASGVGLGHQSSKQGDAVTEANRATTGGGPMEFLEKTKEVARQRWESLQ